jgi:type IV secretion system protein VirD4
MSFRITGLNKTWKQDLLVLIACILLAYFVSFWLALIGFIVYVVINNSNQKADHQKELAEYNRTCVNQFMQLGSSPEERENRIKEMFNTKKGTISFCQHLDFMDKVQDSNGAWVRRKSFIRFDIHRNITAMEHREREFLRGAMLLFNSGKLTETQYCYYLFAFLNGNGKASLNSWNYSVWDKGRGIKDGPSAVKFYQDQSDGSTDSAVNHLLKLLDTLGDDRVAQEIKDRMRGGNAWLGPQDLEGSMFNKPHDYKIILGKLDQTNTEVTFSGDGSLMTIAPPGSGKTQCFVLPNMLNWPGPALVFDAKGDIYEGTAKWRERNVGPVYKFSPLEPETSHSYNPLVFIRQDPDYIWEDSRFLADMMIVPSGASEPYWENAARDALNAAIAYVCMYNDPENRAMKKVLDIMYGIGWNDMVDALRANVLVSAMQQVGYSLSTIEKKTLDGVLKVAQSSLSAWQGERIARVTKRSDWSPMDLRTGNITIYICINMDALDSYLSVLRVFIAQHIRMLVKKLPPPNSPPILFMIDELPRLKKMPPIDEALNIGRQYGIKLWMFAQTYGQLKECSSNPEGMLGSCAVRTFMNVPINDELTTKLSELLGYRDGPLDTTKEKLVEPSELAGPKYQDIALVLATNTKPIKLRKSYAWQDEELSAKIALSQKLLS